MIFIIIAIVIFVLLLGGVIFSIIYTMPIAKKLYTDQWTRHGDYSFERGCSDKSFDYHLDMFNQGMAIREENKVYIKEVDIISEGLHLYGEYYDFGFDKCVILLPGRMETAYYAPYYMPPFKKCGYNMLAIDPRAHGLSEGEYITLGKHEAIDTIEWAKLLHDKFNIKHVCIYGLCGGATCANYIFTNKDCPDYIDMFIADGMFISFFEMYREHIKDEHKPVYPVIWELFHLIKKHNDVNPYEAKPIKMIKKVTVPTLIISGELDKFALPKLAQKLYRNSSGLPKKLVYIPHARHSHVRYDNTEMFDKTVEEFLTLNSPK